jgi:hypothetical protein
MLIHGLPNGEGVPRPSFTTRSLPRNTLLCQPGATVLVASWLGEQVLFATMEAFQEVSMLLSISDIKDIIHSPEYQAIPFTAKDGVSGLWWQKAENVAHLGADLSVWEIASAMEAFFATYKDVSTPIELGMKWERGEGGDYIVATLELNYASYYPEAPDGVDGKLLDAMEDVDGLEALNFLHRAVEGAVCASFPLETQKVCDAFEGSFNTIEQARTTLSQINPDVLMRIQSLVDAKQLENQTPVKSARASPRF